MTTGIDYGLGITNIDHDNGIRYGVISQNSILQAWSDESEPVYAEITEFENEDVCENCGFTFAEHDADFTSMTDDKPCHNFALDLSLVEQNPTEWIYAQDGYAMTQSYDDPDIFVIASPYYTYAPFCSPCARGAGDLDNAHKINLFNAIKTYCVGHDWFENGVAPYTVYRVSDRALVMPETETANESDNTEEGFDSIKPAQFWKVALPILREESGSALGEFAFVAAFMAIILIGVHMWVHPLF